MSAKEDAQSINAEPSSTISREDSEGQVLAKPSVHYPQQPVHQDAASAAVPEDLEPAVVDFTATAQSSNKPVITHKLPKPVQAAKDLKRKDGPDEPLIEPGSSSALLLSDLPWWTSEEQIRGWCASVECEELLQTLSFHEHKVTGKSKGQAFVAFSTTTAACSVKKLIHAFSGDSEDKPPVSVEYSDPKSNPFRSQAKDSNPNKRTSTKHSAMMPPPPNLMKSSRANRGGYENMTYSSAVGYNPQAFAQLLGPKPVNSGYSMPHGHAVPMTQGRGAHHRGQNSRRGGVTVPIIPPSWVQPQMMYGAQNAMMAPAQPVYATGPVMFQPPGYYAPDPDPLHGHKRVRQQ